MGSIAETLLMGIGKRRTSSAVRVLVAQAALVIVRVASGEPVVRAGLVELAVQVVREALAELAVQVAPAGLAVQAGEPELGTVLAAAELEIVLVEAELEIVRVAAELERGREGAERPHARVVAAATASVTVAHLHGLQLLAAVEDLAAAVAEIMREPAATGEAVAWAVAVTAAAEVADVAVE
jgi:phage terminase large subunit-like protein